MRAHFYGLSDVGKRREKNEDSYLIDEPLNFCMVADGMGGHLGGEIASKLAVTTIHQALRHLEKDPETTLEEGVSIKRGDPASYLRYAISLASQEIHNKADQETKLKGMGTTSVCALFRKNLVYIANVGDSRAYRIRDNKIVQMTKDHSLVGEQIRAGFLSQDDARGHRFKNIITRSVGFQKSVDADIDIRAIRSGDTYLLCSDGLTNMVLDDEIRDIVLHNSPQAACQRLIDVANERGGDDNATVILATVEQGKDTVDAEAPTLEAE